MLTRQIFLNSQTGSTAVLVMRRSVAAVAGWAVHKTAAQATARTTLRKGKAPKPGDKVLTIEEPPIFS